MMMVTLEIGELISVGTVIAIAAVSFFTTKLNRSDIKTLKDGHERHDQALMVIALAQKDSGIRDAILVGVMKRNSPADLSIEDIRAIIEGGNAPVPEWALDIFRDIVDSGEPINNDVDLYAALGRRIEDVDLHEVETFGLSVRAAVAIMDYCIKRARGYGEGGADRLLREIGAIS